MKILLTGGAGFIGSHTIIELDKAGYDVIVVDNLYNSNPKALDRVGQIIGKQIPFYKADIRDHEALTKIFDAERPDAVIHFAGLKAVGESVAKPLEYYHNNMTGTFILLDVMRNHNCKNIIFSSSATVYGDPVQIPITEQCPKGHCTNPYGQTKSMLEEVLMDVQKADPEWNVVLLRYFNPIGAHPSGLIGENPNGIPNNLMPYITQVAIGKRPDWESLAMIILPTMERVCATIFMFAIWLLVMWLPCKQSRGNVVLESTILELVMAIACWMWSMHSRSQTEYL